VDSKKVIRSYMVISSLYTLSASLIWGVNTLFLLKSGLDIFGVFIANAVFTAAMVVFEIPTGVVADTSGRRTSFLLSTAVLCLATLGYVGVSLAGGNLFWFCLMSVFLGLGFAFYSGAVEAWLVDALQATNYDGELDQVFARAGVVTGILMLIGTIAGGFLGSLNLAIPYLGRALLLALVCGWGYVYMREIGYTPRALTAAAIPAEMRKVARESITYGWAKLPVRLIMIVTFVQGLYLIWGFYATQPYFLDLLGQPDAIWVSGVVTALVSLTGVVGSWLVNRIMSRFRFRTTILIATSLIFTLSTIAVGLVNSFWLAVPLFLLGSLVSSIFTPVRQAYLHQLIPSAQRATVISFNSMMDSAGGVVGQTGLGYLSERAGIGSGFVVGGAATFLVIPFLFLLRRLGDPADQIKEGEEIPPSGVPAAVVTEEG
jgi:MFS family permease